VVNGRSPLRRHSKFYPLLLSLVIFATVPLSWAWSRPSANVGSLSGPGDSTVASRRHTQQSPSAAGAQLEAGSSLKFRVHSGLLARFRQGPHPIPPVRLRIPAIAVDAPVVPVGVRVGTDSMEIPLDVSVVGWYRFSSQPGQAGSSVLIGHVDSKAQGAGALFRLRELMPGAAIVVRLVDGTAHRFTVIARRQYGKDALPLGVFARSGRPILTLITCGGPFDYTTGHYLDNVVVFALPAGPPAGTA
jgi:hypothetical protein